MTLQEFLLRPLTGRFYSLTEIEAMLEAARLKGISVPAPAKVKRIRKAK